MTTVLIQADGRMPNLALARIASWSVARGDHVRLVTEPTDDVGTERGVVYGSTLFNGALSSRRLAAFDTRFGPIVWGGTGTDETRTLEALRAWQRWVVRGWYAKIPWSKFDDVRLTAVDRPPRFDTSIAEALVEAERSRRSTKGASGRGEPNK